MTESVTDSQSCTPISGDLEKLERISNAIEGGAGLPAVTRAATAALDASIAVIDTAGAVLAVAAASPADEKRLLACGPGVSSFDLIVGGGPVGTLRLRARDEEVGGAVLRMIITMIALEVERTIGPDRADQQIVATLIADLVTRGDAGSGELATRGAEAGVDLAKGGAFVLARTAPRQPGAKDWRARALLVIDRAARSVHGAAIAAQVDRGEAGATAETFVLAPGAGAEVVARIAEVVEQEMRASLGEFALTIGYGRVAASVDDLYRAGQEALLAANVAEASASESPVAFEDTGAYRLLLPAMCDDPDELRRFYGETVEPLVAYDEQYETDLVQTVETFLEADGNVAGTAQRLFTHRHTVRYRLERVRDLTSLDCSSTDGREKLGLGLKAMRVLGIANPHGPATENGAQAGRVPHQAEGAR